MAKPFQDLLHAEWGYLMPLVAWAQFSQLPGQAGLVEILCAEQQHHAGGGRQQKVKQVAKVIIVAGIARQMVQPVNYHEEGAVALAFTAGSFEELAAAIATGDLHKRLRGEPAASGFKRLN